MRRWGIAFFLLIRSASLVRAAVAPNWVEPDYPARAVVSRPRYAVTHLLVNVPKDILRSRAAGSERLGFVARDYLGRRLTHRVIHSDKSGTDVLVKTAGQSARQPLYLYCKEGKGSKEDGGMADLLPLAVEIYRQAGESAPTSWQKMSYLHHKAGNPERVIRKGYFDEIESLPRKDKKRKKIRKILLCRSMLLVPESGSYRFALDCRDAGFLLIDGEPAAEWPGKHEPGQWRTGPALTLSAGVHLLEFFNSCRDKYKARVGWIPPATTRKDGAADPLPTLLPRRLLVSGYQAVGVRIEGIHRTFQPSFTHALRPSYGFRNHPAVFTPVRFSNTTKNWIRGSMTCRWSFDDHGPASAEGNSAIHIFSSVSRVKAVLHVRDSLGFTGSLSQPVDLRFVQPRLYLLAARVVSLPAVSYISDEVRPLLRLRGKVPEGTPLEISWEVVARHGNTESKRHRLDGLTDVADIPLVATSVGALSRITWRVAHSGIDLSEGTILFVRPPFKALPSRVEGDQLFDQHGQQLVLVPFHTAKRFTQPALRGRKWPGRMTILDDAWVADDRPARLLPGLVEEAMGSLRKREMAMGRQAGVAMKVATLSFCEKGTADHAYDPLAKLARVPAVADDKPGVMVLSLGMADILSKIEVGDFERRAAALTDIMSATLKQPVLWVTPPPFAKDSRRIRQFAATIKRVADARRIPVVDLFTAFSTAEEGRRPLLDERFLALSERGERFAAELIIRAFMSPSGELD